MDVDGRKGHGKGSSGWIKCFAGGRPGSYPLWKRLWVTAAGGYRAEG